MWDFINFWGRRDAKYWFLEKYAEIGVLYPDAPISYVGHSNGTYIAANALECSKMVRLDRVLFAGSVVRADFDWSRSQGRVRSVLNLIATADWVLARLPGAFERLGLRLLRVGAASQTEEHHARAASRWAAAMCSR
jgi:alpha-beta hydrolase superfamily lysophospholipase